MGIIFSLFSLFLVIGGTILFVSPWGQFPLNDDWVYAKNVVMTLANGKFTISSGQYAYSIPQVFLGLLAVKPGQDPFVALRWIGILSGLLSSVALSSVCLRALNTKNAFLFFLSCLSVFFFLPCLQTSFSFMTDMPAFLLWLSSVWALANFLEKRSFGSWLLAFFLNALAISERQLAFLIPFVMIVFEGRKISHLKGLNGFVKFLKRNVPLMVFALPLILIQIWWNYISPLKSPPLGFSPNPGVFVRLFCHLIQLGWLAIPFCFVPKVSFQELESDSKKIFKVCATLFILGGLFNEGNSLIHGGFSFPPFFGNVLSKVGILPEVLPGFSEPIFPTWFQVCLLFVGTWGAYQIFKGFSLLWGEIYESPMKRVICLSSLGYFVFIIFRHTHFDRYSIPIIPLCILSLLRVCKQEQSPSRFVRPIALLTSALYISFSATLVWDYFRWNEARWEAIDYALSEGVPKDKLWGGYEYFGWSNLLYNWEMRPMLPFIVRPSRLKDFEVIKNFSYPSIWGSKEREMFLLKQQGVNFSFK